MNFYATYKHHSQLGYWEKLQAKTLTSAKREATKRFGGGYHGGVIHLVACPPGLEDRLNDYPWRYTKMIASYPTRWKEERV